MSTTTAVWTLVAAVLLAAACSATQAAESPTTAAFVEDSGTTVTVAPVEVRAVSPAFGMARTPTAAADEAVEPAWAPTASPDFAVNIRPIDPSIAARMSDSWREGCPVALEDLRLLEVPHIDFAGEVARGELVVHRDVADDVATVFRVLFLVGYPIERMELVDVYGADDNASMEANNTSAFNCRTVAGSSRWSEHAYGRAIDINPLVNPYVQGRYVAPAAGAAYVDRSAAHPGLITSGDEVIQAFRSIGWEWGGYWTSAKDYQHFSESGR